MRIDIDRLYLIPCTLEILREIDKLNVETSFNLKGIPLKVSPQWLKEFKNVIEIFMDELKRKPDIVPWSVWMIISKENNMIIGDGGFKGKPDKEGIVEIGYQIGPCFRNRGYATEAVKGLINWAFRQENVNTVMAECKEDNISSARVLEKVGMEKISLNGDMLKWRIDKEKDENRIKIL